MKKLFLLDAYALIYRFHYAFISSPMRNPSGQNVSAVFGFVKFLMELIDREHPHHLGVAFDPKGGCFRRELYEPYKANRQATPEDIITAVPIIKQILCAMRIPTLEVARYEADDVIGTLATKAAETGEFQTFMVTPDKDYGQLVSDLVSIYKPAKGNNGIEILGPTEVCAAHGISHPRQVVDILAIWGDASDNIPGVPGIGEKGASKLIGEFGSVELILQNLDRLTAKNREKIEANAEQLKLSKTLATICLDVPIEFNPDELIIESPDYEALRTIYLEHNFRYFLRMLDSEQRHISEGGTPVTTVPEQIIKTTPYSAQTAVQASLFDEPTEPLDAKPFATPPRTEQSSSYNDVHNTTHNYITVIDPVELRTLVDKWRTRERIAIDTETTSLDAMRCRVVGVSIAEESHTAYWIPTPPSLADEIFSILRPLIEDEKVEKIGQNVKYDILALAQHGISVKGYLADTMIMHYLLDAEGRHSMDSMARNFLQYSPIPIEQLIGKGSKQLSMDCVPMPIISEYAAEDADITLQIYDAIAPLVIEREQEALYRQIEEPLIGVLADMEREGVKINTSILSNIAVDLNSQLSEIESNIRDIADDDKININSPKQLGELLFDRLKIDEKAKKTKTGQYKTDEETLAALASSHPIVEQILRYRGLKKLLSTYVEALPALINPTTGRLHTSFNQASTATGRLSSSNPNLQNIPIRDKEGREIRRAFVAEREGWVLIAADYSQIELRIMADLSGDEALRAAFINDEDVHTATAAKIFGVEQSEVTKEQRRRAKTANFGIIYGISVFGLTQRLGISRAEAKYLIDSYFELYPGVRRYMDEVIALGKAQGYVETIFGRRRYLPDINSNNATMRGLAERNAINAPIQGSAADIMKIAMIDVARTIKEQGLKGRIILQIHDEIVIEAPRTEVDAIKAILQSKMSGAAKLSIPLLIDIGIGNNWLDAH